MDKRFFNVPEPVTFNCWKHHLLFLREISSSAGPEELAQGLKRIGSSQMDLYTGKLTPTEISEKVISFLKDQNAIKKKAFSEWLTQAKNPGYRLITLEEGSKWTIRYLKKSERYIHIHPARHSAHTLRIKASTLKTALVYASLKINGSADMEVVNQARKKYLNLPPVNSAERAEGLINAIKLFDENHAAGY